MVGGFGGAAAISKAGIGAIFIQAVIKIIDFYFSCTASWNRYISDCFHDYSFTLLRDLSPS